MKKKILLVEPSFPIPRKSRNHKNFLPIGLLKIGMYLSQQKHQVMLVRGNETIDNISKKFIEINPKLKNTPIIPDEILITSLFTYWSEKFWDSVIHYRSLYRNSPTQPIIKVGGVYVSLFYKDRNFIEMCKKYQVRPYKGLLYSAERAGPDYSLLGPDNGLNYQIIHTSRGCTRKCKFCGTHIIESDFPYNRVGNYKKVDGFNFLVKKSIISEIKKHYPNQNRIIFYDNNLLYNHIYIEDILKEIIDYNKRIKMQNKGKKIKKPLLFCESQSGFDGRVLMEKPGIAELLKKANFKNIRIAWDNSLKDKEWIKKQLDILHQAGFPHKDMFVFMLYNWDHDYYELEQKRISCWEWKVQIADCRFRPLNIEHEKYRPRMDQQYTEDYFIHENWTDLKIKQFRRNIRRQNISVRQNKPFYSSFLEREKLTKDEYYKYFNGEKVLSDIWMHDMIHEPSRELYSKKYW